MRRKESIITSPLESEDLGFEQKSALSEEITKEAVSSGNLSFTLVLMWGNRSELELRIWKRLLILGHEFHGEDRVLLKWIRRETNVGAMSLVWMQQRGKSHWVDTVPTTPCGTVRGGSMWSRHWRLFPRDSQRDGLDENHCEVRLPRERELSVSP